MSGLAEAIELERSLAKLLEQIRHAPYTKEAALNTDHQRFKSLLLQFEERASEIKSLSLAAHDYLTIERLEKLEADVKKHQLDSHLVFLESKRKTAKSSLLGKREPAKLTSAGDTLAEDITDQLVRLDQSLKAQVDFSSRNVSTTERSIKTLSEVRHRYSEFSQVNRHSQRLVKRYKDKKRREHLMIMAAFGVFLAVCAFVFLRRMPLFSLLLKLVLRTGSLVFTRRPIAPPPLTVRPPPQQHPEL